MLQMNREQKKCWFKFVFGVKRSNIVSSWCSRALLSPVIIYHRLWFCCFPCCYSLSLSTSLHVYAHKILFIYPTELAVMQEAITIHHTFYDKYKDWRKSAQREQAREWVREVIRLMDCAWHLKFIFTTLYTFYVNHHLWYFLVCFHS